MAIRIKTSDHIGGLKLHIGRVCVCVYMHITRPYGIHSSRTTTTAAPVDQQRDHPPRMYLVSPLRKDILIISSKPLQIAQRDSGGRFICV